VPFFIPFVQGFKCMSGNRPSYRFGKRKHLKSSKVIQRVFSEGQSAGKYPLRAFWLFSELGDGEAGGAQAGFTAPRRKYRKATDRNLLKRLMREAYRLQKSQLNDQIPENVKLALFFVYTGKEILSFRRIEEAMIKLLKRISKEMDTTD
jgi:ribonuclease P protein component